MKRYRVVYRVTGSPSIEMSRTEDVDADGWRVDTDKVVLYQSETGADDTPVFDVPTERVMRIQELRG